MGTFKRLEPSQRTANQNILMDNPEFADMYGALDGDMSLHQWAGGLNRMYSKINAPGLMPSEHTFGWRALRLVQEGLVKMKEYVPCDCKVCVED